MAEPSETTAARPRALPPAPARLIEEGSPIEGTWAGAIRDARFAGLGPEYAHGLLDRRMVEKRWQALFLATPQAMVSLAIIDGGYLSSGINRGANLALDVLYSGTVAAAMEGTAMGLPSFAISLATRGEPDFAPAAAFARKLAAEVARRGLPPGTLLNVNVPPGKPGGASITRIGKRSFSAAVVQKLDPRGRAYYWIGGDEQAHENVPGSDCDAVFDRALVSITPLHLDLTLHALVEELKKWDLPGLVP